MGNSKSEKLIGSLAIMKTELIESDFISSYIPFVASALLKISDTDDSIQIQRLLETFTQMFGFTIERAPMVMILNKCAKLGLVQKHRNGTYCIVKSACESKAIDEKELSRSQEKYSLIVARLRTYEKENYDIDVSEEEAGSAFMKFLSDNSVKTLTLDFDDDNKIEGLTQKQSTYIISKFICWAKEEDGDTYALIKDIAVAYLMSSAIAYGDNDEKTQIDAFKNLVIYLDTPFIFRLLGLNDESMQQADKELLDQLKQLNAHFRIFDHTLVEVENILQDCLKWINNEEYDETYASPALRTFVKNKFTAKDIQDYIDTLNLKLKYYGISVDSEDYYIGKYYNSQISEAELYKAIVETYNNTYYPKRKRATIEYDAKSIANILKLWNGKSARTYRQAQYILLTTNTTLAYMTRSLPDNPSARNNIYPCVTVNYLGTNVWLSAPINKIESFSEKKLLADCAAIIHPSDKMVEKLTQIIQQLLQDETITKEQFYLLKSKAFDHDYLMNKTLSDETQFSDVIVEELLEEIEEEIKRPLEEQIQELRTFNSKKETENSMQAQELQEYRERDLNIQKENEERLRNYKKKASQTVDIISNFGIGFLCISLISIFLAAVPLLSFLGTGVRNAMCWGGIIVFVLSLVFVILMKFDCKKICSKMEAALFEHYEKKYAMEKAVQNLRNAESNV